MQRIVVSGFLCKAGKVLLVRRVQSERFLPGMWELPGGKTELGESLQVALIREFHEETGFIVNVDAPYNAYDYITKEKHVIAIDFIVTGGSVKITLSDDHDEFAWVTEHDLKKYPMTPEMLAAVLAGFRANS